MTKIRLVLVAICFLSVTACALKGSKSEERYEGKSNCSQPGFTCGKMRRKTNDGLAPTAEGSQDNLLPSFSGGNNYAPLCRTKNDKCVCSCEPVN